jgi:NAD(P)-dependent dehydrogenase (short-subunit alcohol dehydrogenase family)
MADRKVALVTGASSGIGEVTAGQLAAAGFRVFGGSRTGSAGHGGTVEHVALDVRDDASVGHCVGQILREAGRIDVLVNNAGYLCAGAVEEVPVAEARAQFETNYFGVARMTTAVLPGMRERRAGHIITISSLTGLAAVPFWGHYSASKFAVEGLMEALRHEVRPFGISVALVEPGAIRTPFDTRPQTAGIDAYATARERMSAAAAELARKAPGPEVVARTVVSIASDPHPALRNKVTKQTRQVMLLKRFTPAAAFEAGIRRSFKLPGQRYARAAANHPGAPGSPLRPARQGRGGSP